MTSYAKSKSAPKSVLVRSPELDQLILQTLDRIARIVGATLGPGGAAVLIERQEFRVRPAGTASRETRYASGRYIKTGGSSRGRSSPWGKAWGGVAS